MSLSDSVGQLTLSIWNGGAGFLAGASAKGGLGLRIMQYRADMIGGTLKIVSANGKGTTVACTFKMIDEQGEFSHKTDSRADRR